MRQISICIPTWERTDMLFESFNKVKDNDNVSEIVIVDDNSSVEVWDEISKRAKGNEKIKMFRNEKNLDCYRNKRRAIELSSNDWIIILDSDNIIDFSYLYHIFQLQEWKSNTIYAPSFAEPNFNYKQFEGLTITKSNVARYIKEPMFMTLLNTFNFFINRNEYLKIWDGSVDPVTSDSEYFNYCWLNAGNKIYVVPDLQYKHRVHDNSHFKKNNHRTNGFDKIVKQKLNSLT